MSIIDYVRKIYLFEPYDDWKETLGYTFEPKENRMDFLKMDIESVYYALEGATRIISNSKYMKRMICTYRLEFAYEMIQRFLLEQQFNVEASKGYMWYLDSYNRMRAPILQRGLTRANKISN